MNHNAKDSFLLRLAGVLIGFAVFGLLTVNLGTGANAQAQKERSRTASAFRESAATQQPPYSDYKGVKVGMTADEARAKLGQPTQQFENQDFFVVSETETVQVFYDAMHRVNAISIDYVGDKTGAPDYKTIVGDNIQVKPDGSMYKLVRYEQLGFWVSFNRTAGDLPIISVTIQKIG
jgi:outer membrane protein assembly factor BamE (lipoprotein component of BamABCDE complex)